MEAGTAGSGLVPVDDITEIGVDGHGDWDAVGISGGDESSGEMGDLSLKLVDFDLELVALTTGFVEEMASIDDPAGIVVAAGTFLGKVRGDSGRLVVGSGI